MIAPQRIQLSRAKGFNLQAASIALNGLAAVNIARPGPWGNPFIVGQDGSRAQCLYLFEMLLGGLYAISARAPLAAQREFVAHAGAHWKSIKGKNLACWCGPKHACHGDILLRVANPAPAPIVCEAS